MNADAKRIPPNCSIQPSELTRRKEHGLTLFAANVDQNRAKEVLKQENWNIMMDYILQNIVITDDVYCTTSSIALLHHLHKRVSDCLIPNDENRVISLNHKDFINPGCLDLFVQLGFIQLDSDLIMIDPDEATINAATETISKRITILKLKGELHKLWTQCMHLMAQHHDYQSQAIFPQILPIDLSTDHTQYADILSKLMAISDECTVETLAMEMLRCLGFHMVIQPKAMKKHSKIWESLCQIYDLFNQIERVYLSISQNEDSIPKLIVPPPDNDLQILPGLATPIGDPIAEKKHHGVNEFQDILNSESKQEMYERLLNAEVWDNLIECICINMQGKSNKSKSARLTSLKHAAEKITGTETKFRRIDMKNKTAKKKLLSVYGGETFLRGLGFNKKNASMLYLDNPSKQILNVAIVCADRKIKVLDTLAEVNQLWQSILAEMIHDPLFSTQIDLLQTLLDMDLSIDDGDAYDEMKLHITDIMECGAHKQDVPLLMLERLGVDAGANVATNVSNAMLFLYDKIQEVEALKRSKALKRLDRAFLSMRIVLNGLWQTCIVLMKQHEAFHQQHYVIKSMKQRDFTDTADYKWLLNQITEVGQLKVYSKDIEAARQIVRNFKFKLPQEADKNEEVMLKCVVNVYHKVEEIEGESDIIHISGGDKYDEQFKNNDDNAIGDFGIESTVRGDQNMNEELLYQMSMNKPLPVLRDRTTVIRCEETILNCAHCKRLFDSLLFFQSLHLEYARDQDELVQYFKDVHTSLLDDQMHVGKYHDAELAQAGVNLGLNCRYDLNCMSLKRYHGQQEWQATLGPDGYTEFVFYRDTMDSVHCYIAHLFDLGLRVNLNEDENWNDGGMVMIDEEYDEDGIVWLGDDEKDEKKSEYSEEEYSPESSASMNYEIDLPDLMHLDSKSNHKSNLINKHRIHAQHAINMSAQLSINRKIKMPKRENHKFKLGNKKADNSWTFIDGMHEYMIMQDMTMEECQEMMYLLISEEYDSDALQDDIDAESTSNVARMLRKHGHYVKICAYNSFTRIMDRSLSIGFRFYYWEYYAKQDVHEVEYFQNKNFHSGYAPYELYVEAKYSNMRDEILNNCCMSLEMVEFNKSLDKAQRYLNLNSIREIRAEENIFLHYDIWDGELLLEEHLLAVTFYCDWSELSTAFSATFRKKHAYEHIALVKKRNAEFAHWSKRLRETVELYGKRGWEKRESGDEQQWNLEHDRIRGPFYCGMDSLMVVPEFNIRFCAPTSMSTSFSVATTFAGDEGIIITLNNNGHWHSDNLRIWDCSWLSGFQGEDEKLIMGGFYTIRIQGIRYIKTSDDYETFFLPLFYFDCMLTGICMLRQRPHIKAWHKKILHNLIFNNDIGNKYVGDTFEAYKLNTKYIVINLHQIHTYFAKLKDLLIETCHQQHWECQVCYSKGNSMHSSRCWMCTVRNSPRLRGVSNVLKASTLEQFPNLQHIVLYTTSGTGQHEYVFDCTKLLNNLINYVSKATDHKVFTCQIKATHQYEIDQNMTMTHQQLSWLSHEWTQYGHTLKAFVTSFNPNSSIILQHTENRGARVYAEDTLFIKIYQ
eukprot:113883_1